MLPFCPKYICPFAEFQLATVTQFYLSRAKAPSHAKGFVPGDPLRECRVILRLEVFHHRHWSRRCVRGALLGSFPSHLMGNSIFRLRLVHSCHRIPSAKPSHLSRLPPEQSQSSLNVIAGLQLLQALKGGWAGCVWGERGGAPQGRARVINAGSPGWLNPSYDDTVQLKEISRDLWAPAKHIKKKVQGSRLPAFAWLLIKDSSRRLNINFLIFPIRERINLFS